MAASRVPAKEELASEHAPGNREEEPDIIGHDRKHSSYMSAISLGSKPVYSQYVRDNSPSEFQHRPDAISLHVPRLISHPE